MGDDLSQQRREREQYWLDHVKRSCQKYNDAVFRVRILMGQRLSPPNSSLALREALQLETAARNEYMYMLQFFSDLVIETKPPE
jgi:hypothetical protein